MRVPGWLVLLVATLPLHAAASSQIQRMGDVQRVERTERGAFVHAAGGAVRVEYSQSGTVRITASRSADFPKDTTHPEANGPYHIVDYGRAPLPITVQEAGNTWRIATTAPNGCVVEIDKSPFQLRVLSGTGATPLLETSRGTAIQFSPGRASGHFSIAPGEHFIGFGAHRHPLDMRGHSIVLTTSELGREGEGGGFPVPWVMSSRGYGLFLNNVDPTTRFDLGKTNNGVLTIDAGDGNREGWNFDLYVIAGSSYAELLQRYIGLTGKPILAEKWFFGNIQSKCCDWRADDVIYIASRFRELQLPLDAMILDLQWREVRPDMWEWTPAFDETHTEAKRNNLKWSSVFGDVPRMFGVLDKLNVKVGLHENTMSTYSDDERGPGPYLGQSFPDVSHPRVAARLWEMHRPLVKQGADFWWHDQGERISGTGANGYPITNLNGSLWAKLVVDGMRTEFKSSVPVLARSGPVGGHRYISPWPGDVPAGLQFAKFDLDYIRNGGLAGYATIGADMGGFYHGSTPDRENEIRRICDMMLVFPVARTHGAYYKLPWMFSSDSQLAYARYLDLRYRLLPYFYSAAIEAHETGRPILAPLCFDYPEEEAYTRDFDFLLGRDLLVAPVTGESEMREVYLPRGNWRNFWTDERHAGGKLIAIPAPLVSERSLPILVKEGAILPTIAPALSIPSELFDRYTFHIYPAPGAASRRTFKDRAQAMDDSHIIATEIISDNAREMIFRAEGVNRCDALYFHGVAKPKRVTVNGVALSEQQMASEKAGWSYGASDFPLQGDTVVLKVRVPEGIRGKAIECVVK